MSDTDKNVTWSDVSWYEVLRNVRKVQYRIYKARLNENFKQLQWLQKFLLNNFGAKLIAIKSSTLQHKTHYSYKQNVECVSPEHVRLACQLSFEPIEKESSFLSDPRYKNPKDITEASILHWGRDTLLRLALDPELEALRTSNAFKSASTHVEAISIVKKNLQLTPYQYFYKLNIEKYLPDINYKLLIERLKSSNIIKSYLRNLLEAEFKTERKDFFTFPKRTHALSLSFKLALYDLQSYFQEPLENKKLDTLPQGNDMEEEQAYLGVTYGNEILLMDPNKWILESRQKKVEEWFNNMGIAYDSEEHKIVSTRNGVCFLGFQINLVTNDSHNVIKIKIEPSRTSQASFLSEIRSIVQSHKSTSSYDLILALRPKILHWGNYFKYFEYKPTFQKLTNLIFQKLRAWVFRRDTKNGRYYIKEKYFPSGNTYNFNGNNHQSNWVLVGEKKDSKNRVKQIYLPHMSWIKGPKLIA